MKQLVNTELRLVELIKESKGIIAEIKKYKTELRGAYESLPKSIKKDYAAEINPLLLKIENALAVLKEETKAAEAIANYMKSHLVWKAAIRAVYGEEGLAACIKEFNRVG